MDGWSPSIFLASWKPFCKIPWNLFCKIPWNHPLTGRHGYTSQNVMAICDFDLRFTFVVVGWPGSVHDTRILNHSLVEHRHKFPFPPKGNIFLCLQSYYLLLNIPLILSWLQLVGNTTLSLPNIPSNGNLVAICRKILPCRFRLSKPKRLPCSISRTNLPSTGVS